MKNTKDNNNTIFTMNDIWPLVKEQRKEVEELERKVSEAYKNHAPYPDIFSLELQLLYTYRALMAYLDTFERVCIVEG